MKILVENLKCSGCVNTVTNAVSKINHVTEVKVDLENECVLIKGDPDRNEVLKILEKLGYPEKGHNSLLNKTKSYVSCAIGRIHGSDEEVSK